MTVPERAIRHAALGDQRRLVIIDRLARSDRTVAELSDLTGMPGNLLAHHLGVLAEAGLIERRTSEGDHRRRYVSLRRDALPPTVAVPPALAGKLAFVCTHNSARSQFAASFWQKLTGSDAASAGTLPAEEVHPKAVRVGSELGVDLSGMRPAGYDSLPENLDLVISVCDRANEADMPRAKERLHWSVADPVAVGSVEAFRSAFGEIAGRVEHLVGS